MKKILKIIGTIFLIVFVLLFCLAYFVLNNMFDDMPECAFTSVDQLSVVDKLEKFGKQYYLVLRVSGWQEKVNILELYDEEPKFDDCANSSVSPIYSEAVSFFISEDSSECVGYLELEYDKLIIKVTKNVEECAKLGNLKIAR